MYLLYTIWWRHFTSGILFINQYTQSNHEKNIRQNANWESTKTSDKYFSKLVKVLKNKKRLGSCSRPKNIKETWQLNVMGTLHWVLWQKMSTNEKTHETQVKHVILFLKNSWFMKTLKRKTYWLPLEAVRQLFWKTVNKGKGPAYILSYMNTQNTNKGNQIIKKSSSL